MSTIPLNIVVEDDLSEVVIRRLLKDSKNKYELRASYPIRNSRNLDASLSGYGYIKKNLPIFNRAAETIPFLALVDLDDRECAPSVIADWLAEPKHNNLLLRVAVKEIESWLLADEKELRAYLHLPNSVLFPSCADSVNDPKIEIVELARKSKLADVKDSMVPRPGTTSEIGPNFNRFLETFAREFWDPIQAGKISDSLARTQRALDNFSPV